ncbi:MAG: hypothetical protein H0U85_01010 [Gemmatimonadales bacterium]|nr:hypothetical protein [Gemmatimonadales bacterium]
MAMSIGITSTLSGQGRVGVGGIAGGGIVAPLGLARETYDAGALALGALTIGRPASRLVFRGEAMYFRLPGEAVPDIDFPAIKVLAFTAGAEYRFGRMHAFAGLGPYNFQVGLPYARYDTRLGVHAGLGVSGTVWGVRAFAEVRGTVLIHATKLPASAAFMTGVRIAR